MELMSPAGNYEAFKKAIEGGADAIYLGLPFFNARKPAKNFGISEITEAVEYAHSENVKVYVTLNIDLKSSELKLLTKILILLTDIFVDAIIIKDLALLYLVENFYFLNQTSSKVLNKKIPIHISTQFGVANSQTLIFLKKNFPSIERVVLAREISYQELTIIGNLDKGKIPEIEVFVQGSMCFSFSGKCLLSSFVGGKSANRGVCQAPCRVKYDIDGKGEENSSSLFSMKDLSLINYIKELDECNITALKIEGRLKNPSWVKEITSIYRDTLDSYLNDENYDSNINFSDSILKREDNLKLYSGRELNSGFLFELDNLTSNHNVHFGKKLGEVVSVNLQSRSIEVSFSSKRDNSSLRFVFENKFLGILHTVDLNEEVIKFKENNLDLFDSIQIGAIVYEVIVNSVVEKKLNQLSSDNGNLELKKIKKNVGMNRYNLIVELISQNNELKITIETDERDIVVYEKYKKVVKVKRGVEPELLFELLIDRHFNGWRIKDFNLINKFLIAKSQVNNLISLVSREIAIVNKDLNLKGIKILDSKLNEELNSFSPVHDNSNNNFETENLFNKLKIIYSNTNSLKFAGDDLVSFVQEYEDFIASNGSNKELFPSTMIIDRLSSKHLSSFEIFISRIKKIDNIMISLFPIIFENEIDELENLISKIEKLSSSSINNRIKIKYEINDFGHIEILNRFNIPKSRMLCGTGISVYNFFAIKTLKELGLSSFHIPLEIDKQSFTDILNFVNNNPNNKMKVRMNIFSRIPLYYSRVESKKFKSGSVYKDSINTEMISNRFNDITIFESKEFYNISQIKFDEFLKVNELIVDLSNEKGIIKKYLSIKTGNFEFSKDLSFNFDRKLQ